MRTRSAFIVLVIAGVAVLGSLFLAAVPRAGAETLTCKVALTATTDKTIPVSDQEGHVLGVRVLEGLALCDNGEIAKQRVEHMYDEIVGASAQGVGYTFWTFEDGSTIVGKIPTIGRRGQ